MLYVHRHSIGVWDQDGMIADIGMTVDEMDRVGDMLKKFAAERRAAGDHPIEAQERNHASFSGQYAGTNRFGLPEDETLKM